MNSIYKKRLGDLLVDYGKITGEQLQEILKLQKKSGKRLGELLIDDGILSEEDILDVLEIQLGIQRVYLDMMNLDKQAVQSIPESLASKYNLIPTGFKENKILVATFDPLNIFADDDVKVVSGYEVEHVLATSTEIKRAIERYYSHEFVQRAAQELSREHAVNAQNTNNRDELDDVKNAPAVKLVDSIIKNAVKARASDIHVEPFEKYIKVRYRVDGELQEVLRTDIETLGAIVTRIKILADLNIAEKRIPQDGRILTSTEGSEIDLRVSILPTVFGEKVVIRVLSRDSFMIGKEKLGMTGDELEKLDRIVKSPYGIILVTGPTGSGKSTTLYSLLNDMNRDDVNIITVEDPVEYLMDGINQVGVNVKAGMTFATGLRSILRQDPDIIMIGEIRDNETAEIAVRAAITGHIVLSTIHTNDSPSAVVRLVDMNIEPYLVATSISGVISQRLVKNICPNCRHEYKASDYEKNILGLSAEEDVALYRGRGCPKCNNTGYSGRIGVFEIMEVTKEHRKMIMDSRSTDDLRDLSIRNGMKTLKMSCRELVLKGETTIDELIKIAYLKE